MNTKNLESVFKKVVNDKKITVSIRLSSNDQLISQQTLQAHKLVNNAREFVKRVNLLTLPYEGKNCYITVDGIELAFVGGKFASNLQKLAKVYTVKYLQFEVNKEEEKILRSEFYNFIDERCTSIVDVVNLIKFVSTVKPYELAQSLNGLKIANNE